MKIGMLFPGYGSQYVGMGKDLYDVSRIIQEHFEEASNCLNENFVKLCFASSDAELSKINNAYPALFLLSVSVAALLQEKGITPNIVAGCDIGAFSAASSAGGLSVPDGLYLLSKFSQFYREARAEMPELSFVRVQNVSRNVLKNECSTISLNVAPVSIALFYGESDHVVAGYAQAIDALANQLVGEQGVEIKECSSAMGLHSWLMNSVMEQFVIYLAKVDFHNISIPFVSGIDAQLIQSGEDIKQTIVNQINCPIAADQIIDQLQCCDLIIEVGVKSQLSSIARERLGDKKIVSIQKKSDVNEALALAGIESDGDKFSDDEDSIVSESENL